MPTYTIRTIGSNGQATAPQIVKRRRDAASLALYRAVYEVLRFSGGLDTRSGWAAAREARDWQRDTFRIDIGWRGYVEIEEDGARA